MATMASLVREIRNLLEDRPAVTQLNGAMTASQTTMTVDDAQQIRAGTVYEFDDGALSNAEVVLSDSSNTLTPTIRRAWEGTTAATHADNLTVWIDPTYRYNKVALAVNTVLETGLLPHLYEIVEHTVTTSSTVGGAYNSPAAVCEFILNIYQDPTTSTTNVPRDLENFDQYRNVDTTLFANGKFFRVYGGVQDGTETFLINCAHPLQVTTVTDPQSRVVAYLATAHLLEWGEPRAVRDQNERRARVGDRARLAAYFRDEGKRMMKRESARLSKFAPPRHEWLRRRPRLVG